MLACVFQNAQKSEAVDQFTCSRSRFRSAVVCILLQLIIQHGQISFLFCFVCYHLLFVFVAVAFLLGKVGTCKVFYPSNSFLPE